MKHLAAGLLVSICALAWGQSASACEGNGRTGFPLVWFSAVPRDGAPDWEILPQEAGPVKIDQMSCTGRFVTSSRTFSASAVER